MTPKFQPNIFYHTKFSLNKVKVRVTVNDCLNFTDKGVDLHGTEVSQDCHNHHYFWENIELVQCIFFFPLVLLELLRHQLELGSPSIPISCN